MVAAWASPRARRRSARDTKTLSDRRNHLIAEAGPGLIERAEIARAALGLFLLERLGQASASCFRSSRPP